MKHTMSDGIDIDDFNTGLVVEIDGENTILTFENARATMQNVFILDRYSLQWLRETLKKASKLTQNPERKE